MDENELERVARRICSGLGLDPDSHVGCGYGDDRTPQEWAADTSGSIPAVMLYMPRWRLYRGRAAEAIATKMALE